MDHWVSEILVTLGYVGLFLLLVVETVFPPIPSEVILPLAGFLAGRSYLDVRWAIVVATLGSYAGATLLYGAGRIGGRTLVLRYGRLLRLDIDKLGTADQWFLRWGPLLVLWGRLVPVARSIVSVPAGTFRMPFWRFSLLTIVGSAAWNTLLIGSGWLLGDNWERVTAWVDRYTTVVLVLATAVALALIAALLARRTATDRRTAPTVPSRPAETTARRPARSRAGRSDQHTDASNPPPRQPEQNR
ncbi:MAG: DedA family protein [Thermomicrobium sp.]|nr:DedA family protein [Thermomicrobium sp.]